jgi:hypothetical protein
VALAGADRRTGTDTDMIHTAIPVLTTFAL